jgi:2-succinyl-5-enolpyruvyl-6-hydroxy-3-cyclohexene-1-carboxylate synthase
MMPHIKQHIRDLAEICLRKDVAQIVISPGSRSAPLIKVFVEAFGERCVSIVDERSAAFFAMGYAIYTGKPVVLICTSGTAVLNYAPALAEAYHQQIPLLVITADRPHEWIDQQDNQTLHQKNIYRNFIKGSFELPQQMLTGDDLWFAHRQINEAANLCTAMPAGPVHMNIPLTEPLYDELPFASENLKIITGNIPEATLKLPDDLVSEWKTARKIMIIHGQDHPDDGTAKVLQTLLKDPRVVIIAENIANIPGKDIIANSNLVLSVSRENSPSYPDLILHSGGQVVSKALTGYLRRSTVSRCWRIGADRTIIDTFRLATRQIPCRPVDVYHAVAGILGESSGDDYRSEWHSVALEVNKLAQDRIATYPFGDVHIFNRVMNAIPDGTLLALGNSSVIRYAQLFPSQQDVLYYSNRGTSGIDGSVSTASGIAFASKKLTIAIVGDLGFLYDSNALWNNQLPVNLRILVINNQGGGIFHIIKGPSEHPGFKKFIEANHPVNIAKLAEAYGLKYMFADDDPSLVRQWPEFIHKQNTPVIFEVRTDALASADAFRKLMAGHDNNKTNYLKQQ